MKSRKSVVLQVLIIVIMRQCSKLLMLEPTWRPFMVLSAITKNISRTAITNHISSTTILLLATFGIVPIWCFCRVVSPGPFFQNDLFKRSFALFRAGSSLLKFHLISCIARRHSSKYMVKYIQQKQQWSSKGSSIKIWFANSFSLTFSLTGSTRTRVY